MRQHGHDDETLHAQRATTIAPRKSERKPEGQILDLQRKLGNSAVTQAVHSGRLPDLGVHARGLPVQRAEDETEESDDEEAFDGAEVAGNATDDEETFDGAETNDEIEDQETLEDATEEGASEEEVLADQEKVLQDKAEEAEDEGEG